MSIGQMYCVLCQVSTSHLPTVHLAATIPFWTLQVCVGRGAFNDFEEPRSVPISKASRTAVAHKVSRASAIQGRQQFIVHRILNFLVFMEFRTNSKFNFRMPTCIEVYGLHNQTISGFDGGKRIESGGQYISFRFGAIKIHYTHLE